MREALYWAQPAILTVRSLLGDVPKVDVEEFWIPVNGDDTANLWDANIGKQIATFTKPEDVVSHTIFNPDGQRVVTVLSDNTVHLWEVNSGKQLMVFKGHKESVYHTVFSADGQQLLTISSDKTMRLWEVQTGKQLAVISGYPGGITYAEFSPGGQCVVTASKDNNIARLWDTQTGKLLVTFEGHEKKVNQAIFTPKDQRVITISDDMTARVWDANYYCGSPLDKVQNKSIVLLRGHEGRVNHVAFSPDNQFVVTASSSGTARLWEVNTGKQQGLFKGYGANFNYVDFSADGQWVIAVSGGGQTSPEHTVLLWDVKTSEQLASFKHERRIEQATLSSDGQRLVTFSQGGTVRVCEANTAKLITTLQERSGFRLLNGQQLITVSKDDKVYLWENNTEKQVAVLENPKKQSFLDAFFSPNGERVVRSNDIPEAGLWDMKTGKQLAVLMPQKTDDLEIMFTRPFTIHAIIENVGLGKRKIEYLDIEYEVELIVFSPDNQHIFGNQALWDADTGKQQMMLERQGWVASYATFNPDSSLVLTTSGTTATLWNVHTGEQVAVLNGHEESILHAAFSPDGQRIVTSLADGTAILWPVFPSTQALLDYAHQIVPRQLSCRESVKFFLVEKGECREGE